MEIVLPLVIAFAFLGWAAWLTVRREEGKDAAREAEDGGSRDRS
jgi:hypothetical protein